MRKGITLTLTTLVVALSAFAFAMGPKISSVPDVYITERTTQFNIASDAYEIDQPAYMFRYSDALTLADYVTPSTGNTSATMSWAYALVSASMSGALDFTWMSGSTVVYQIGDIPASTPALQRDGTGWGTSQAWSDDINGVDSIPATIVSQNLADAGSLTFRNIRLNPLPGLNPVDPPTQNPARTDLPAGILDIQEATLFVFDGTTLPATDEILLVTLLSNTEVPTDQCLSAAGPVYELDKALTDTSARYGATTSGWLAFGSGYAANIMQNSNMGGTGSPLTYGLTDTGSFYASFSAVNNTTYPYAVAAMQTVSVAGSSVPDQGLTVAGDRVYRMKGTVASTNTVAANNAGVRLSITGLSAVGEGFAEFTQQSTATAATYKHGPVSGTPATLKAFFWPQGDGYCDLLVAIWDIYDNVQGSITVSNVEIESFEAAKLEGANVLVDMGTGAASQFAVDAITGFDSNATNKFFFAKAPLATGGTTPTASADPDPTAAGNRNVLSVTGTANTNIAQGGVAEWLGVNNFTTSADPKLVVAKFMASTTSGESVKIPEMHLAIQEQLGNMRQGGFVLRKIQGGVKKNEAYDLTTVAAPVRLVIESLPSQKYGLEFFSILTVDTDDSNNIFQGNLTIERATVTEYDLPEER
jgi:hypothetical protein